MDLGIDPDAVPGPGLPVGVVDRGRVTDLLAVAARAEAGRIALSEAASGRVLTWAGLAEGVDRVASGLSAVGLVAGYRVAIALTNRIEFVVAYLAGLRAGLVVVPLNPRGTTGEMVRILADSGARLVVAEAATLPVVRAAVAGLEEAIAAGGDRLDGSVAPRVVPVDAPAEGGEVAWEALLGHDPAPPTLRDDPEEIAVLLYTSGTSGLPRGAMLSHRALRANVDQVAAVRPPMIVGQDVVLGVLPLFHVYGLNAVLGQVLRQHARLVLVDGFDAEESLDLIEDEAVSIVPVAPPVLAYWMQVPGLEDRLGPVRLVLSGSAPLAPELTAAFTARTGVAVHQGYGLTEAAPVVTSTLCSGRATDADAGDEGAVGDAGAVDPDPRSVGAALPGVELRLRDEDGAEPESGDPGEIEIRGANLFSGYWPDGADGPRADGWFATGDVGQLGPGGGLHLVDRLKELVIVSGFNVYPSEVEDAIAELSEVARVAVIGVPDERSGEAVVAYVLPAAGAVVADLPELVRAHCARRLARFKWPSVVQVVEELPYTATGKVQKGRLRAAERRRALGLLEEPARVSPA